MDEDRPSCVFERLGVTYTIIHTLTH